MSGASTYPGDGVSSSLIKHEDDAETVLRVSEVEMIYGLELHLYSEAQLEVARKLSGMGE